MRAGVEFLGAYHLQSSCANLTERKANDLMKAVAGARLRSDMTPIEYWLEINRPIMEDRKVNPGFCVFNAMIDAGRVKNLVFLLLDDTYDGGGLDQRCRHVRRRTPRAACLAGLPGQVAVTTPQP